MGQTVAAIAGSADQEAKDVSDFLDNGELLLKERNKTFQDQVMLSNAGTNQIPVSKFLQKKYEMRISVAKDCKIQEEVTNVIKGFCDGKYAKAIGTMIGVVTTAIFGQSSGSVSEQTGYFIIVGLTGAIMRIDYLVYLKQVKAQALTKVARNFYMCSYMVSSVDVKGLTFNDFASAVELCYASLSVPQKLELISVLEKHYDAR